METASVNTKRINMSDILIPEYRELLIRISDHALDQQPLVLSSEECFIIEYSSMLLIETLRDDSAIIDTLISQGLLKLTTPLET